MVNWREVLTLVAGQVAGQAVDEYIVPRVPTIAGLSGEVIAGIAGVFVSDRFLSGDARTIGMVASTNILASGIVKMIKEYTAAPKAVPAEVRAAPAIKLA